MYEKPLIHRGDTLGARASPYSTLKCNSRYKKDSQRAMSTLAV